MTHKTVKELFASDIHRRIEEVIKVDQADEQIIKDELAEYVVTNSLRGHFIDILEQYRETPNKPHEGVGGVRPKPRKLNVASSKMTKPKSSMAITKTAIQMDGRTYLPIWRIRLAPIDLAAST